MKNRMNRVKKTILITGASGDIGHACAEIFLHQGDRVILQSYRHPERVSKLLKKFGARRVILINCDATSESLVNEQFQLLKNKHKINKIDVLVNNAGDLIKRCPVGQLEWSLLEKIINVNIKTAFLFTKYSLPLMKRGASIIFISSLTSRSGKGDRSSAYALAKGGLISWSKCLANELGPRGITVNTVTPGFITGNFHDRYTTKKVENEHAKRNPLRRNGQPKDVGAAVSFFASLNDSYISGTTLDVCGAEYMA